MRNDVGRAQVGTTELVNLGDSVLIRDLDSGNSVTVPEESIEDVAHAIEVAARDD